MTFIFGSLEITAFNKHSGVGASFSRHCNKCIKTQQMPCAILSFFELISKVFEVLR